MKGPVQTKLLWLAVAILAFAMSAQAAGNGTVSGQLTVSATVVPNCKFSLTPLAFGTYDPLASNNSSPVDGSANLIVTCTRNSQINIQMNQGQYVVSGSTSRMLASGNDRLSYEIYRDAARTQTWGQGTDGLQVLAKGVLTPQQFTVYGRIPPGQEVPAGTYSDLVTATVDF